MKCFIDLCSLLWNKTLVYYQIDEWHRSYVNSEPPLLSSNSTLLQKLQTGKIRLWQDVQNKTRTFLLSSDLSQFTIDEFLRILDVVSRLIEIGQQFCNRFDCL